MPAKKVAISLSEEALHSVDHYAEKEGISRSAWFERAVRRAQREAGMKAALAQATAEGIPASSEAELEALRHEIERAG